LKIFPDEGAIKPGKVRMDRQGCGGAEVGRGKSQTGSIIDAAIKGASGLGLSAYLLSEFDGEGKGDVIRGKRRREGRGAADGKKEYRPLAMRGSIGGFQPRGHLRFIPSLRTRL
jgi:hypothetical protein